MIRVLSGVVLAAAALAAILFLPPIGLRILVAIVAAAAAFEYLALVGIDDSRRPAYMFAVFMNRGSGQQAILGAFAILYISMPLGLLAALHIARGWRATVLLIATVVVSDSLQFYSGRLFGRHALAPAISPKKTIEGAIGGAIAGTLFMVLAGPLVFPDFPPLMLAVLGFVMVVLGILGDLFESRLKREANVKDSSSLIPGHGGVLDRIDALLFVTPAFVVAVGVVR
jgi:CDP-diglyceride synthetase